MKLKHTIIALLAVVWALPLRAELPAMHCDRAEYGLKAAYTDWFVRSLDGTPMNMRVLYVGDKKNPMIVLNFRDNGTGMYADMSAYVDAVRSTESTFLKPVSNHIDLEGTSQWRLTGAESEASLLFVGHDWDHDAECKVLTFMIPLNLMSGDDSKWKAKKAPVVLNSFTSGRISSVKYLLGHPQRTRFSNSIEIALPEDFPEIIKGLILLHKNTK